MRAWLLVAGAALLGVAFVVVLRIPGMSDLAVLLLSNVGQLLAAVLAAARLRGRRPPHARPPPAGLVAGSRPAPASWAAGQVVWSYYEVVLGREVPFPSLADVGFLLFPLLAAVGLVIWLGTPERPARGARAATSSTALIIAVLPAGALLGHHARAPSWPSGGDSRLAADALARLPGRRPDPGHPGAAGPGPRPRRRAGDAGRARPRPRRPRGRGQRLRLPGQPGAVLLRRPDQQRLGVRLPVRRRRRPDRPDRARARRHRCQTRTGPTGAREPSLLRLVAALRPARRGRRRALRQTCSHAPGTPTVDLLLGSAWSCSCSPASSSR